MLATPTPQQTLLETRELETGSSLQSPSKWPSSACQLQLRACPPPGFAVLSAKPLSALVQTPSTALQLTSAFSPGPCYRLSVHSRTQATVHLNTPFLFRELTEKLPKLGNYPFLTASLLALTMSCYCKQKWGAASTDRLQERAPSRHSSRVSLTDGKNSSVLPASLAVQPLLVGNTTLSWMYAHVLRLGHQRDAQIYRSSAVTGRNSAGCFSDP